MSKTRDAAPEAPTSPTGQPTISTLRLRQVDPLETEHVLMRVTAKGHGQISTGEEFGFERYAMFAEFVCPASTARMHYNRGWAEPVGSVEEVRAMTLKWLARDNEAAKADARSKAQRDRILEHGAEPGTTAGWN